MAEHPYVVLDVFTDTPLEGNPVAVFTEGELIDPALMQPIARELNLSETVFVLTPSHGTDARLRIFTPTVELPFAGHPTLGTAFVVGDRLGTDEVRLQTGAGLVPLRLTRSDGRITFGEMEQPLPRWSDFADAEAMLAAVGVERSELPVEVYENGPRFAYVALPDAEAVSALSPDFRALLELGPVGACCFAVDGQEVRARMFGPGLGVAEDPATGSAAGPLAVHLSRHGVIAFGDSITITQGVEIGRRSVLTARAEGDSERLERVVVGGSAVLVAHGTYQLP